MRYSRVATLSPAIVFIAVFASVLAWQAIDEFDLMQQQKIDNLHSRVQTIEARAGIQATIYPFPTPTQEINVIQWARNGDRFVRTLRDKPDLSGNQVGTLELNALVQLCVNVPPITADGYIWRRVYAQQETWLSMSKGSVQYVTPIASFDSGNQAWCE